MKKMMTYVPVLHRGYADFIAANVAQTPELILIDGQAVAEWLPMHKEIHALKSEELVKELTALWPELQVTVLEELTDFKEKVATGEELTELELIVADELAARTVIEKLGLEERGVKIDWQNIFLRWDKQRVLAKQEPVVAAELSTDQVNRDLLKIAQAEGRKSADWWRQVGALLLKDGQIIAQAHNTHLPHEQQPNVEGDMRANFSRGEQWELTTAIHAEALLIAQAAKEVGGLDDTELLVTDFPCPNCAKLIAAAGIKTVYFQKGYALADGQRTLAAVGVRLVRISE